MRVASIHVDVLGGWPPRWRVESNGELDEINPGGGADEQALCSTGGLRVGLRLIGRTTVAKQPLQSAGLDAKVLRTVCDNRMDMETLIAGQPWEAKLIFKFTSFFFFFGREGRSVGLAWLGSSSR